MRDVLQRLAAQTSETVHLALADFPSIVYVDKVDSPHPVRMFSRIGNQQPAYSTSVGKAMLAHASTETVEMVISNGMPARTSQTIITADRLRKELAVIRERGYSIDDIENEEGIRCVAAPIFDQSGTSLSGISVSRSSGTGYMGEGFGVRTPRGRSRERDLAAPRSGTVTMSLGTLDHLGGQAGR
jgi:DNA-binding IclR family transcriptional regulator